MKYSFYVIVALSYLSVSLYGSNGIQVVTNTNDSGAGSLRQAIINANADANTPHTIIFSISGSGVKTIAPLSELPAVTNQYTLIDGTTQSGWSATTPMIELSGANLPAYAYNGLTLSGVSNCVIQGIIVNNGFNNGIIITDNGIGSNYNTITLCFIGTDATGTTAVPNYNGITISGSASYANNFNTIGGSSLSQTNIISGNTNYGINLVTNVNNSVIQNNYIGTDVTGTNAIPNVTGISITGSLTPLISELAQENSMSANIISGNSSCGIMLQSNAWYNSILDNFIGVDVTGTVAMPNLIGIQLQGTYDPLDPSNGSVSNNTISESNIISGNTTHGMYFYRNVVKSAIDGNFIGTDISATLNLGNGGNGILIQGVANAPCSNNEIGNTQSNYIAYNGAYGVYINSDATLTTPDIQNPIVGNFIFNNNNNGIQLHNNGNDLQATATITNVVLNANRDAVIIEVSAPSTPSSTTYRLDFFINMTDRSPITEGQIWVGSVDSIASGASTTQFFALPSTLTSDVYVSVTATNDDAVYYGHGDSSQFASNILTVTLPTNVPSYMFS